MMVDKSSFLKPTQRLILTMCSLWLSLLAVSLSCRDWRDEACAHTLHIIWSIYYNHSGLSLSLNQTVLHCINLNGMHVIRSLVYRTCWRREEKRKGQQRCWLNNVKPVTLFVQFFGSVGYYQKQPYLGGRHYKTHDPCPNMPQCFV